MLEVGWFSTKLLLKGKLLQNPWYFTREMAIGIMVSFVLIIGLDKLGANLWVTISLAAFITGLIMPFLLKDVKMQ
ncbi:hypothetical protein H6G89_29810 [Oscillatoria sp. FACHB-1407]|uniref:hypothetical protein n=1 Tax=Oscillatoria sp. FACHB-1407 TaxID=2692847 RepID=UPI0016863C4D|nr:hypothetical protein [Oscillatoria sp. FACHB-1407]MBD2465209.1 hypothetical protein [Oscillatoria sp. FACHB-1407]